MKNGEYNGFMQVHSSKKADAQTGIVTALRKVPRFLKRRLNFFYVLAFVPLVLIAYYSVFRVVIPMYGFILLLLKRDKLLSFNEPHLVQRSFGVLVLIFSFFVYYMVVPVFPALVDPYGIPNYVMHLLGLFLIFFNFSALKEAFTPLFLIIAATSGFFLSEILRRPLSPLLIPLFMRIVETTLGILRLPITVNHSSRIMTLHTWRGSIPTRFVWGCVGFYSTMAFSVILVVILVEERSPLRAKLLWATIGIIGTNVVNLVRVILIFLTDYAYGAEMGAQVHYFIGYVLFMTWLTLFLLVMSKKLLRERKEKIPAKGNR